MAPRKRTEAQISVDFIEIENLSLQGYNSREIAEILSKSRDYTLSRQQVQYDIDKLDEIWKAETVSEIDSAKRRILAEIKDLQKEYWEAWQRSLKDAESQIVEQKGAITEKDGKSTRKVTPIRGIKKTEGQSGNPAFLRGVEWCIAKRCEILGLDAPKKMEHTGKDGQPLPATEIVGYKIFIPDNGRNDTSPSDSTPA